ncbi:MAG TPA: hypothetical protein VE569_03560 [Acidimicrobiia bacterium]|nr:hypothetical protein [Acidimicrobiia bacterium]
MRRVLTVLAALVLIAATPEDVLTSLHADGYYIEEGSGATEQVVSDAVFDGRADGGRLYIVVLAEEPGGGATTFSDSTLDLLGGDGYVLTVAPETVGYAGEDTAWTADQMDEAVGASLNGGSDDAVVELFIAELTGESGGGIPWTLILILGGGAFGGWWYFSNRRRTAQRLAGQLAKAKALAKEKLDEVANDIIELEDEVSTYDNDEVKQHYQNASALYSRGIDDTERAETVSEMLRVSQQLDLAIWELDCVEALLDGKEKPPKPEPPKIEPVPSPQTSPTSQGVPQRPEDFDRRPQRQSGGSDELMGALLTMIAMGGMRGGRGGGFGGGFGGGGFGGGRFGGGGFRGGGGGRIRGGGHRG